MPSRAARRLSTAQMGGSCAIKRCHEMVLKTVENEYLTPVPSPKGRNRVETQETFTDRRRTKKQKPHALTHRSEHSL